MRIVPFADHHIEDAAVLVAQRFENLRGLIPALPECYEDAAAIRSLVHDLTEYNTGVVAINGGRLIGFLVGMILPEFRGRRSVYSPEWGNAAVEDRSREIYQRMYAALSDTWVSERCNAHYVSVFAHDKLGIEAWFWQGFGMMGVDAIRNLSPVEGATIEASIEITLATPGDVDALRQLDTTLRNYSRSAPIFLINDDSPDRTTWEKFLQGDGNRVWLAHHGGKPIAFLQISPANPEACTVMHDPKTVSIIGAFTEEAHRSRGVATVLLNRTLVWAQEHGKRRCAVNFEPMNILGARFWLSYFQPFCYSMQRIVVDTPTKGN